MSVAMFMELAAWRKSLYSWPGTILVPVFALSVRFGRGREVE